MRIGLVYDLRDDYLALGYSEAGGGRVRLRRHHRRSWTRRSRRSGAAVERIGRGQVLAARLVAGERWDLVFSIAEGLKGRSREAQVPALLRSCSISLTSSPTR